MARKKLSEFSAKKIVSDALAIPFQSATVSTESTVPEFKKEVTYVVKVDEGVKKRMKQGLVVLDVKANEIPLAIKKLQQKGFSHCIIEPFIQHDKSSEKYLSLERVREGIQILYSEKGGIDIEDNTEHIKKIIIPNSTLYEVIPVKKGILQKDSSLRGNDKVKFLLKDLQMDDVLFMQLLQCFEDNYFSFLEINPLVIEENRMYLLDIAAEVDSAASFFVSNRWSADAFRSGERKEKSKAEIAVQELSGNSQASFTLNVLHPDGGIFMLLSGGGASIVLADEVYNAGYGKQLANYGEYSGNPNAEETYLYTRTITDVVLHSKAKKKVLIIGGGVANFTDIRVTFRGVIKALEEQVKPLQKEKLKVYVRRGGPHQQEGLLMMENFLKSNNLYGYVSDQTTPLPEIVKRAINQLK